MDALVHPADSRESDNRTGVRELNPRVRSYGATQAEVQWNDNAATALPLDLPHGLAKDANGSHLVSFLFALTVLMILTTGLTAAGFGILVTSAWLAGVGFFTTLIGCLLYGWSLYDV